MPTTFCTFICDMTLGVGSGARAYYKELKLVSFLLSEFGSLYLSFYFGSGNVYSRKIEGGPLFLTPVLCSFVLLLSFVRWKGKIGKRGRFSFLGLQARFSFFFFVFKNCRGAKINVYAWGTGKTMFESERKSVRLIWVRETSFLFLVCFCVFVRVCVCR